MDDERAESVQSAIVRAARTADTIQAVHDVVECRANVLLDLSREEDNIINKINQNIHHMKGKRKERVKVTLFKVNTVKVTFELLLFRVAGSRLSRR